MTLPLHRRSLAELERALMVGEATAESTTELCLERIRRLDGAVNAFVSVDAEGARAAARASDARRREGALLGPLDGVPIGLKDVFCTQGLTTTAGSEILGDYRPTYDATVVVRLRAAGAVILGKLNLDAFAMGSETRHSRYGPTRNPWDLERVPGGSSGGSASAVAAGFCYAALGSDTGGSVRQPAALTGTVGLKPTYGLLSRYGLVAFASSLDCPGIHGRTVDDVARVLSVVAGPDPLDATSLARDAAAPPAGRPAPPATAVDPARWTLGVPVEYFGPAVDPEVAERVQAAIAFFREAGATIREVCLPHTEAALPAYYVVASAEASTNLARYDGVRYGRRARAETLDGLWRRSRTEGFGDEVKRRILLGTFALSAGYREAYYLKAARVRTLVRRDFERAFEEVDALLAPTTPTPAWRHDETSEDPVSGYHADALTVPASLAGLPALSVPCGLTASGLPVGLQIIGRPLGEREILELAAAWEAEWRIPVPEGFA